MSELNSRLQECEQIYRRLDDALEGWPDLSASAISDDRREFWSDAILLLVYILNDIASLLRSTNFDGVVGDVAPEPWKFYRETVEPNRNRIAQLAMELLGRDGDDRYFVFGGKGDTVWNILQSGVDFWRSYDEYTQDEVNQAEEIINSPWFSPQEWIRNSAAIHPMLGRSAERRIPGHVRIRLWELSRSFILGNNLAAIALARAILEYTIIDRAPNLGINPRANGLRDPNRCKRLSVLVDEASGRRPKLMDAMNEIVDAGNETLHPRRGSAIGLLPSALRAKALTSVQSVHLVVEALYLE